MRSTIPLDIFAEIISYFRRDKTTLIRCSFICKSALPLCQKILFSTIDLSRVRSDSTYNRLAHLFTESPHLSSYVKSLTLYIRYKGALDDPSYHYRPFPDEDDALCRTFLTFNQLKNLTILVYIGQGMKASDGVQTVIHHLLALPTISSVEFKGGDGFDLPISFLDMLNHIPHITITCLLLDYPVNPLGDIRSTKPTSLSLKTLQEPTLQALAKIASDPNISLDLSSLASLHIIHEGSFYDYPEKPIQHHGVSEILKMTSESLTQFSWSSDRKWSLGSIRTLTTHFPDILNLPMLESIDGSPLQAVRSIKFKFTAKDNFNLSAQLKAATKFISTIPTSGSYEIGFNCFWERWYDKTGGWNFPEWQALGNTIAHRTATVKLRVFLGCPGFGRGGFLDVENEIDEGVVGLGQNLVSLVEKKVLSVEVFWSRDSKQHFVTALQESRNSFCLTRRLGGLSALLFSYRCSWECIMREEVVDFDHAWLGSE